MLTITEILRAQNVNRWNLIAVTREQSIAEHTFNVITIVRAAAKRLDIRDEMLIKAAFEHDLDETVTGDIPSPTKAKGQQLGFDFGDLEGIKKNVDRLVPLDRSVLKAADLMEAIHYLDNFGTGHRAAVVKDELTETLRHRLEQERHQYGEQYYEVMTDLFDEILFGERE